MYILCIVREKLLSYVFCLLACCVTDTLALQITVDGGVAAVVEAMKACRDNPEVQVYGCWALANIAWNKGSVSFACLGFAVTFHFTFSLCGMYHV